jgi:hypothetical protein
MRKRLVMLICLLITGTNLWAAGLGERFSVFEKKWNKGFRQEFSVGGAYTDVYIGSDKKHSVAYSKGGWNDFDGRIGTIHGETWGMFGVPGNQLPTTRQFLTGIKAMMPADSKLISKFASSKAGYLTEVYLFKSVSLSKLPGIAKSTAYDQETKSIGRFVLIVNHNIDDSNYVINYTLTLGSGESDIWGMKKVKTGL